MILCSLGACITLTAPLVISLTEQRIIGNGTYPDFYFDELEISLSNDRVDFTPRDIHHDGFETPQQFKKRLAKASRNLKMSGRP